MKKRTLALALVLALLPGLTACGKREEPPEETAVCLAERIDYTSELEWIADGCGAGEDLYLLGCVPEIDENGCHNGDRDRLIRIPLEGGAAQPLPDYRSIAGESGWNVRSFPVPLSLHAGTDGSLWQAENVREIVYDLPGDFDRYTGDWGLYDSEARSRWVLRQLDGSGKELFRFERDEEELNSLLHFEELIELLPDGGDVVVLGAAAVGVLTAAGEVRFTLPMDHLLEDFTVTPALVLLGDGRVGVTYPMGMGADFYLCLRTIDKEAHSWGKEYLLPFDGGVYDGDENALFYYLAGSDLRAWREDTQTAGEGEKLLNWLDAGIDCEALHFVEPMEDGRVAALARTGENSMWIANRTDVTPGATELLLLSSGPSEKKVLTYATLGLSGEDRAAILEFNRTNPEYQIMVKDYLDYSAGGSRQDAITRLATEVGAGKMPDILVIEDLPVDQWGAAGLLEDLWPWIDLDRDISRENLMERVFQAMEVDGKLYEITDAFQFWTLMGAKELVGDRMSWTTEDLEAALAKLPEGSVGIDEGGTGLLLSMLNLDWDQFVDWEKGTCSFDSQEFRELLKFCGGFPENVSGDRWERVNDGRQVVCSIFMNDFESVQVAKAVVNGEVSFVGYPNETGKVGSSFFAPRTLSMSSSCRYKEGAWAFLRTMLLPGGRPTNPFWQQNKFFTNRESFEKAAQAAMSSEISHASYYGNICVRYDKVSQEEYDQIMALYNAVDTFYRQNINLETIIEEAAGAYFAGDKSLDETAELIQNRAKLYVSEQA